MTNLARLPPLGLKQPKPVRGTRRDDARHAAWTGHHSLAEVEHYTADADRRKAVLGQAKRA